MNVNTANDIHLKPTSPEEKSVDFSDAKKNVKKQVNKIVPVNFQKKSILKIELNEDIKSMTQEEFEKFLNEKIVDNTWIEELDLSELVKDKKIHYYLYNIVWNNFPLVWISRLIEWNKMIDLTFLWIKDLNDKISKESVDLFIWKFKEVINHNFEQIINNERAWRLVRNNYKHLSFSQRNDLDIREKMFGNENTKKGLIDKVLNSISNSEMTDDIKQIIIGTFDFWIWSSFIKWKTIKEKLKSFYMWEISSRNIAELDELWENINFDFGKIQKLSKEIIQIEKNIISDFSKEQFIYENTNYDVVINWEINPILLRFIRKWEKISVIDTQLHENIKEYINKLTDWFDFISPVIYKEDYKNIDEINKQIWSWVIDIDYFQNNYKKTLSIESLKAYSKNKTWMRLFIDIVDMWIMNLKDFKKLAQKVNFWEINENYFDELLTAWWTVTNKFQRLVKSIKEIYPESKISLWWDEVFIFIPGKTDTERDEIISNISKKINRFWLKWRISSSTEKQNEKIFNNLDNFTSINKLFEKKFTETLQNNSQLNTSWKIEPKVTNLEIKNEKLIKWNLDTIKKLIKEKINNIDFTWLLFKRKSINTTVNLNIEDETWKKVNHNLNLEIENNNNFITIKIN